MRLYVLCESQPVLPHRLHSVPNSGTFIRPTATLFYGISFLSALSSKYIEVPHGSDVQEKVILGSSGGAIEVEAVGLDRIRGNLARLERLREVSLDNEFVSKADPPGQIARTCPGTYFQKRLILVLLHVCLFCQLLGHEHCPL